MVKLEFFLLGPPRIELGGAIVEPDTRKATALLAYLAMSGELHTREELAALLWPDYDDQRARAALRRTLSALKAALGAEALLISRETLGWSKKICGVMDCHFRSQPLPSPLINTDR